MEFKVNPFYGLPKEIAPLWKTDDMKREYTKQFFYWCRMNTNPRYWALTCPEQVDRVSNISLEEFREKYERPNKPCIITDLTLDWKATTEWSRDQLLKDHGNTIVCHFLPPLLTLQFRAGSGFKMTLSHFIQYMENNREVKPLYLFDQAYPDNAKKMMGEYAIPYLFEEDLFKLTGEEERPPYRWVLVGGTSSGVPFHTDPRGTSAWNTVLFGMKRWAMYPPNIQPPGVGPDNAEYYDAPPAVKWYMLHYHLATQMDVKPVECTHGPGETIFIPSGWWHTVINLDTTIAITQNFASSANFERVARDMIDTSDSDDDFVQVFYHTLEDERPDLYAEWTTIATDYPHRKHAYKATPSSSSDSSDSDSDSY